jgi:hypothetical protein
VEGNNVLWNAGNDPPDQAAQKTVILMNRREHLRSRGARHFLNSEAVFPVAVWVDK